MSRVCPKCNCNDNDKNSAYCKNCGAKLSGNYCTNPDCTLNGDDEPIELSHDSCYCDVCGSKTEFYKEGIIQPKKYPSREW